MPTHQGTSVLSCRDAIRFEPAMLDENLMRAELSPAERAKATARRKAVYLKLHPETAAGVAGGKARQGSASAKLAFAEDTAAASGRSERAVQRDNERGEKVMGAAVNRCGGIVVPW